MSREELIDKMVTDVMEGFDFETVHNVMVSLNWKWAIGDGKMTIPSIYRIMRTANWLLKTAASHYGEEERFTTGTGGFQATLDEGYLTLQFILSETAVNIEDYKNTD